MIKKKNMMAAAKRIELAVRSDGAKDALCSRKKWILTGNKTR
jgi:hypothetical protein